MAEQMVHDSPPRVTELVGGIVHDAQELVRQQLTLFQVEFKNDMRRTVSASIPLFAGVMVLLIGAITLAAALGLWLSWFWPELPLWGSFAIAGLNLALIGGALVMWGKAKFDAFNPLPEKSLEGLKENIQWKTKT